MLKAVICILAVGLAGRALPAQGDAHGRRVPAQDLAPRDTDVREGIPDSSGPAMPTEVAHYRRVYSAKLVVDGIPGMVYRYARDHDIIAVLVTQYDPSQALRAPNDTVDLVRDDYNTAFDTLCSMAAQRDANVSWYVHAEDDLHIDGRTYRGFVFRYALFRGPSGGRGCLDHTVRVQGWSYFQQTYALPQGIVRIRGHLQPFESVGNGALPDFSKSLIASMVHDPGSA